MARFAAALAFAQLLLIAGALPVLPNRTTIECGEAVSQDERANCTITTFDERGEPTAGASASDFGITYSPELSDPSPMQGGPIYWYVTFATCKMGRHNVTVNHLDQINATDQALVIPAAAAGNFA